MPGYKSDQLPTKCARSVDPGQPENEEGDLRHHRLDAFVLGLTWESTNWNEAIEIQDFSRLVGEFEPATKAERGERKKRGANYSQHLVPMPQCRSDGLIRG